MYTGARIIDLFKKPIQGKFDLSHLKAIHKYIFQYIYPCAGELRLVNISKEILFCDAQFIEKTISKVFDKLAQENYLRDCSEKNIAEKAAYYLGEINAVHPFREGNGRAQREFARELCLKCGYMLDLTRTTRKEMLTASIASFDKGDNSGLIEVFGKSVIPIEEYENYKSNLTSSLLILSSDDME
jgi:cell filamentation protein